MTISEYLKELYGLETQPNGNEVQKWYIHTLKYKNLGYESHDAGFLAAKEVFLLSGTLQEFSEANESYEIRNQIDNIDTLLSIIRGKK